MLSQKPIIEESDQLSLFPKGDVNASENEQEAPLARSDGVPGTSVLIGTVGSARVPPLAGWSKPVISLRR